MADARRRYDPTRPRKLLLHRREIERLVGKTVTVYKPSGVKHPGTYKGVIEKIPYLKSLGVTAIYLNPVFMSASLKKRGSA